MINVAVIGCGYWGPNLIRNFNQIDSTNLYYICDANQKKMEPLQKAYPTVRSTTDYKEILNDSKVDAVAIAIPIAKHYSIAKESLLKDKHILIEKPMTSSVKEAVDLIKAAEKKNKVLMVDHTFEYAEAINKIKEIISSEELGDICYIRAEWFNLGLLQPDVNVIWDLVTHVASIINYTTGLHPKSLNANASAFIRKEIPEVAHMHIKYPKNITAFVTVSWLEPRKTRSVTIVGSKKLLVYDLTNTEEPIKVYDKGVDIEKSTGDIRQMRINYRYGDIFSPNVKNIEPLKVMCQHFAGCITNNTPPRSGGKAGLGVLKILQAAEESLRNNGKEINL